MKRAAIIGGGIGGLTTAIALRKIGFEVSIYERAGELKEVGSGMSLWPNAVRSLNQIDPDILSRIATRGRLLRRLLMKDAGGEPIKTLDEKSIQHIWADFDAFRRADESAKVASKH